MGNHQLNDIPFTVVEMKDESLTSLPAEVAQFVRGRALGMVTGCYCHIVLKALLDEVYVLRGTYDDAWVYGPPSFIPRVMGNYIFFFASSDEPTLSPLGEESIWILSDWRDHVAVSTGQTFLRLNELGPQDQEMIFICQVKVTRVPSTDEKGKEEGDAE